MNSKKLNIIIDDHPNIKIYRGGSYILIIIDSDHIRIYHSSHSWEVDSDIPYYKLVKMIEYCDPEFLEKLEKLLKAWLQT